MWRANGRAWRVAAAAAVVVGALGAVSYAQQPGPGRGPGPGWGPEFHGQRGRAFGPGGRLGIPLGQLELTDAQRQQVAAIVEGHRAEMRQLAERSREARQAVRQASEAQPFDENAVRAASNVLAAVMADGAVLRAKVRAEVMGVLTDEQRAKAAQLGAQAEQRMQQRKQRMEERRQQRLQQRQQNPGGVG